MNRRNTIKCRKETREEDFIFEINMEYINKEKFSKDKTPIPEQLF